jgi:cytoskeleton-associated protein 5
LITQITSGDPHPSIDALKKLDKILSTQPDMVIPDVDPLVNAITLQVRLAFSALDGRSAPLTRLCKHLVNALVLLFSNRQLASHVSQDALHRLLQELAHRLLDVDMLSVETGPQLSKALNVAMVKVLEFSDRNASISALLSILVNCAAELQPGDSTACKEARFTELIMKCLWKLSKTIQEHMRNGSLNPDQLLFDINNFFVTTPPTEWKHRAAEQVPFGEMPLRTAKTLILELITGLGDNVFDHLTLIDDPQRSCVYPYLHHMLQARRKKQEVDQQSTQSAPRAIAAEGRTQEASISRASRPSSIASMNDLNGSRPVSIAESTGSFEPPPPPKPSAFSIPADKQQPEPMEEVQDSQQTNDAPSDGAKTLTDVEMNNLLTQIFVKIGTREKTKQVK